MVNAMVLAPVLPVQAQITDRGGRYYGNVWASRPPVIAQHGMAATAQPLATQVAIDRRRRRGQRLWRYWLQVFAWSRPKRRGLAQQ